MVADDVVHAGMFLLLTVTGLLLPVRWPALIVGLAGYAAFLEVVQAVAPLHRSGSLWDMLADLTGVGLALLSIGAARTVHQRTTHRAGERDTPKLGGSQGRCIGGQGRRER